MKVRKENGFIKEIIVVAIAILILGYLNIDVQTAAAYIKTFISWIINLITN